MSLLIKHGHLEARFYPLGMVWDETTIVARRERAEDAGRAALMQMAVSSILDKKANKAFNKTIKEMTRDE